MLVKDKFTEKIFKDFIKNSSDSKLIKYYKNFWNDNSPSDVEFIITSLVLLLETRDTKLFDSPIEPDWELNPLEDFLKNEYILAENLLEILKFFQNNSSKDKKFIFDKFSEFSLSFEYLILFFYFFDVTIKLELTNKEIIYNKMVDEVKRTVFFSDSFDDFNLKNLKDNEFKTIFNIYRRKLEQKHKSLINQLK